MKKLISLLVVLAMLMAISPVVFAEEPPIGSIGNMATLVLGENTVEVPANPDGAPEQDYFYAWGTEVAGTFTIDFADDSEGTPYCQIYVNNMPLDEVISEKGGSMSVELEANSMLWIEIGEYNYQAATFTFTATFVAADAEGGMAGSGTEEDPWIIEALPVTLEGAFTEDEAVNEDFGGHYYQFTVTEAGTVSWSQWKNCGLFVTVNGAWADADARDVVPGDVVVINTFPFYAAEYTATIEFEASTGGEGGEGGEEGGEVVEGIHLGDNLFEIPEASNDGDVFVATEDGTLVIVVTGMWIFDAELGDYVEVAPGNHIGRIGNYLLVIDGVEQTGNVASVEVVAGQEVEIYIATTFGAAAKATVNLSMEEEEQPGGENDTPASGTVDVTATSPIVYELVLDADATVTITVTSTAGWEIHIGNADGSVDSRYWSDSNTSPVTEALAAGTYTITINGYDEVTWDYIDATITYEISTDAENEPGDEPGDEPGACDHANAQLDYEYYEDDSGFDLILVCPDCGEILERYAPGEHEWNPLLVEFLYDEATNTASTTVTVPAGTTLWVGAYNIGGMMLTINGVDQGILEDMGPWDPIVITLTNEGAEDATYELVLSYPLGTSNNPDDMIMDEAFELNLPENSNGYVYEWIATADGTVTLVVDGANWVYFVNNFGDPENWDDDQYGDYFFHVYDDPNTYTFKVKAGDQVQFNFSTQDADWNTPAEILTITATFTAEGAGEPAEPTEIFLGDNEMADGEFTFTATQTGTLYFRVVGLSYEYGDLSDEIRSYLGEDVLLYVNGELVAEGFFGFLEVTEGDVITFQWESAGYYDYAGVLNLSYENNNPALGSQERPIQLGYADCPVSTPELAPGEGLWYELSQEFYDATLTIVGENAFVTYNYYSFEIWDVVSETIYAENGVIVLSPIPALMIQVGNAGTEAATIQIEANIPEGTAGNPADLVIGENVAEIEVNRPDYFYFDWTAPSDGTLTVKVSGDFWHFYVVNLATDEYSDWLFFYNDPVVDTVTFTVAEGDQIIVAVSTCINWNDPNLESYDLPAGTIYVNASFEGVEPPCGHKNLVHFDAIEPGCHFEGNIEYWVCYDCECVWQDEALTQLTNIKNVVLPAKGGEVVHVEAKAPTCTENGNIEHWYCEECEKVWQDAALTQLTNHKNVIVPATGHTFVDGVCHCGAKDENPPTGDAIAIFCALVAVSSMGLAVLPKKKEN